MEFGVQENPILQRIEFLLSNTILKSLFRILMKYRNSWSHWHAWMIYFQVRGKSLVKLCLTAFALTMYLMPQQ